MSFLAIGLAALFSAGLTLFSGFGLGTLLLPAFAFFFPLDLAVAATAVVHLANNLFKLALLGRRAHVSTVLRFGLPAAAAAIAGAWLLERTGELEPLHRYNGLGRSLAITPIGLALGALMVGFAILEAVPRFSKWTVAPRWLPLGGALSGFFGGFSGHQGALRSMFLLKLGLDRSAFVATGVVCAVLVDLARLAIYSESFLTRHLQALREGHGLALLVVAIAGAFVGSFVGSRLVEKVTLRAVQRVVAALLIAIGVGLASGAID